MKGTGAVNLVTDQGRTAGASTPTPLDVTRRARECVDRAAHDDSDHERLLDMLGLQPKEET